MRLLSSVLCICLLLVIMTGCGTEPTQTASGAVSSEANDASVVSEAPSAEAADASAEASPEAHESASDSEADSAASADESSSGNNTLVVYFSASGNTRSAANDISALTGADVFELVPQEPYTDADLNWREEGSRVNQEHDDPSLQDIPLTETTVPGWDSYDTVFFGYPIWWGEAAWPVREFVTSNDFSGKTVIPFCTSTSSGIGSSGELLAELAGSGDWTEGQRFASEPSESEVSEWIATLGV